MPASVFGAFATQKLHDELGWDAPLVSLSACSVLSTVLTWTFPRHRPRYRMSSNTICEHPSLQRWPEGEDVACTMATKMNCVQKVWGCRAVLARAALEVFRWQLHPPILWWNFTECLRDLFQSQTRPTPSPSSCLISKITWLLWFAGAINCTELMDRLTF